MTHNPLSDLLGPDPAADGGRRARAETDPGFDPTAGSDPVTPGPEDPEDPYDDDFAEEIPPHRRVPLLTASLVGAIALGLAFTGGVVVQQQLGSGSTTAASGSPSGMPGLPGGSGGIPGGMSGFPGMGSTAGNNGTSTGASSGPVLIGTVVEVDGTKVTVKDLSGKTYVVSTTTSTTVSKSTSTPLTGLKAGDTVSVEGTKSGQNVAASAVTNRGR